jgi:hypothetical protein
MVGIYIQNAVTIKVPVLSDFPGLGTAGKKSEIQTKFH